MTGVRMDLYSRALSLHQWAARLVSGQPHQVIGGEDDGKPYMLRWYVIPKNRWCKVYVHKFLRSDEDRALHDHPWWFLSLVLRGSYVEHTPTRRVTRRPGTVAYRRAEHRHRVALLPQPCATCHGSGTGWAPVSGGKWMETDCGTCDGSGTTGETPAWTLIVTGPKARPWGFWCVRQRHLGRRTEDFVPWRQWGAAGCGEYDD